MADRSDVIAFYDERMLAHEPDANVSFLPGRLDKRIREILTGLNVPWKYPEHPGRLTAIRSLLETDPIPGLRIEPGAPATRELLARGHIQLYLDDILKLRGRSAWLDLDTTAVSPGSVDAAIVAAGTAALATEAVVKRRCESAFAIVRPPGHHAEPARARGFCLFNNVAVAAAHARTALGCQRVMIVDWDAHHGNGTQSIFWSDPDVLFFDIHRASPFYPGSGRMDDIGSGAGEGTTVNVPLPGGAGDQAYLKAFQELLVPAADWFRPDLILISAGFDPHWHDLALNVSHDCFSAMTGILQAVARRHCEGRLVFVLEGGYNLDSLSRGVRTVLEVLAGGTPAEPGIRGVAEVEEAIAYHIEAFIPPAGGPDPEGPAG